MNHEEYVTSVIIKYSHIIIHAKRTIAVPNTGTAAASNNRNKKIFKNCVPFTNHKSEKNNAEADGAHDIDVVMPRHNVVIFIWKDQEI